MSQKLRQPIAGSSGATSTISMMPIGMYALQAAITTSRFSRVTSCASTLGIASTTARKPIPSMMRAASRTSASGAPAPIRLPSVMTAIPPTRHRPAPTRPTTRPAAMPVVAPSVANVATISPARSRPSAKSVRIIGTAMTALPICAAATTPLHMSSSTCSLSRRGVELDVR